MSYPTTSSLPRTVSLARSVWTPVSQLAGHVLTYLFSGVSTDASDVVYWMAGASSAGVAVDGSLGNPLGPGDRVLVPGSTNVYVLALADNLSVRVQEFGQ